MFFRYKDCDYEVEILRKKNKNTYVRVKNGKIYVSTNYLVSSRVINKLLCDNYESISKMIDKDADKTQKQKIFLLFGKCYDIIYDKFRENILIEKGCIKVYDEKTLYKWLKNYIYTVYYNRLMFWYNKFEENVPIPNLCIRKMKTRWGVCNTKNNNITLNFELYRYDMDCLDYVIIHELSHFIEHNHSKDFWKIVEKYCPNYKKIRTKLRS